MKYVIWGTGPYCQEKLPYMKMEEIAAFVEREKKIFHSKTTILPKELCYLEYDYIVIMSTHIFEIIPEILQLGISHEKILPGMNFRPFINDELEYMNSHTEVKVTREGTLLYIIDGNKEYIFESPEDWKDVRHIMCREENADHIKRMSVMPVGRKFGYDRGESICRYYLKEFFEEHREYIRGNVLEIGDRRYTTEYGDKNSESYVLHFGESVSESDRYDFQGDLRDGKGLKENFYDCIILTQVLMFISDITNVAEVLLKSLKHNGRILITVCGITPISRYDMDRWGHFFNFTALSLREMFARDDVMCKITTKGNCKVACAYLQGMSATELTSDELDYMDENFPVVIMGEIIKCGGEKK